MSHAMMSSEVFPATYADAATRWRDAIAKVPMVTDTACFPCAGEGPTGETLETQVAWIGSENAPKVLVLIAATHGIEGFAGSAVMLDFLRTLADLSYVPDAGTAILCIHALNPWGYAWFRRCDAQGIDLNRNFVDFTAALPENSGYQALASALVAPDSRTRQAAFDQYIQAHGQRAWEVAVSGGQYTDPKGPFFGGQVPAHGRTVIEAVFDRYGLAKRTLAVIDVHTGLGPYGYGELICDHAPQSEGARTARAWFGEAVTLPALGNSCSVPKSGLLDYAWHRIMGPGSSFVTLEFGTLGVHSLFEVLLNDHAWWAIQESLPKTNDITWCEVRAAMVRHFYPNDRAWREMVLFRARQVILQALDGLLVGA